MRPAREVAEAINDTGWDDLDALTALVEARDREVIGGALGFVRDVAVRACDGVGDEPCLCDPCRARRALASGPKEGT